jgi:hypothetical protein
MMLEAGFDVFNDLALHRFRGQVVHLHRANVAATFEHSKNGSLARAASSGVLALPFVLVAFPPTDERFVDFDLAAEGPVERFGLRRFAEPMRHEPCGLLSDPDKTHKCGECRQRFSIKVGTIFEDTKLPLRKWFIAIWLITSHKKGIASTQLARDVRGGARTWSQQAHGRVLREGRSPHPACRRVGDPSAGDGFYVFVGFIA